MTGAGDEVAFRRAEAADAATVRDLARRARAKRIPPIGREPLPMTFDQAAPSST